LRQSHNWLQFNADTGSIKNPNARVIHGYFARLAFMVSGNALVFALPSVMVMVFAGWYCWLLGGDRFIEAAIISLVAFYPLWRLT
jgi:hypothetical protein